MNKEAAASAALLGSNSGFHLTKSKLNSCRLILLTSLAWVLIDAFFLLFYINDYGSNLSSISNVGLSQQQCLRCEIKLEKLERELTAQRAAYSRLIQSAPKSRLDSLFNKTERLEKLKKFKYQSPKSSLSDDELPAIFRPDAEDESAKVKKKDEWFREEFSNEKHNPLSWPGENGKGVIVPDKLKKKAEERFKENQFNIVASDLIALNRSVPDQRSEACQKREYPVDLPTTSIIIVHHNEANSTLLRTLVSIVRKSPLRYIKEIILVDDLSEDRPYLGKPLDDFVKTLPVKVVVMRNTERSGLMRSRLRGAAVAKGDTMTFLDAHVEVTNGWLPPLLYEIKKNRKSIPCPVIDVIQYESFEYITASEEVYGGLDGTLTFNWLSIPVQENKRRKMDMSTPIRRAVACPIIDVIEENDFKYVSGSEGTIGGFDYKITFHWITVGKDENQRRGGDKSLAMRTPTMAGGLFTIDRSYFYEIGTYDEGMEIWGAENIEMSFRVWMCGGTLLILPCSHVGHVFRKHTPYKFPGGTDKVIYKNNRRMIDVWTDEYAPYFHKIMPELDGVEAGDLTPRIELRKNLQCKSFRWYLENIYPNAPIPLHFYHLGSIKNDYTEFCLDNLGRKSGEDVGASECHGQGGNQLFEFSKNNQLKNRGNCLDTKGKPGAVRIENCEESQLSQKWEYDDINGYIVNKATQTCLSVYEANRKVVVTVNCDPNSEYLKWSFSDPLTIEKETEDFNLDI